MAIILVSIIVSYHRFSYFVSKHTFVYRCVNRILANVSEVVSVFFVPYFGHVFKFPLIFFGVNGFDL